MKGIIAHNALGIIGLNGEIPWKSSLDLKHFKNLTKGGKLLVGFNTAIKLPPLIGRDLIIDDRLETIDTSDIDWCIGGKKTYEKYCHLFTELHVSIIKDNTFGDTTYPNFKDINEGCKIFYYAYETDDTIFKWYKRGLDSKLNETNKCCLDGDVLLKAYRLGIEDGELGTIKSIEHVINSILK